MEVAPPSGAPMPAPPDDAGGSPPCDLSTVCPDCGSMMAPEHAHYRCAMCGYRDTCCDGQPLH